MSAPIGPGDWVECVAIEIANAPKPARGGRPLPGNVYRVRDVMLARCTETLRPMYGLLLDGIYSYHANGKEGAWHPKLFRPIYPGGKLIPLLLEKLPEDEKLDLRVDA